MTRDIAAIIAGVVAIASLVAAYLFGWNVASSQGEAALASARADFAARVAAANAATAKAEGDMRELERRHAADMAALDAKHTKEMTDAKSNEERAVAALRAGTVSVRERFTCPAAAAAGQAGQAGAAAGVGDAGPAGGLQAADAEFLLREAARADEVAIQLGACQAIVTKDREGQE